MHFAPSSAKHVSPILDKYFEVEGGGGQGGGRRKARLAAIGPTTASYLHDDMGLRVDVVAAKPTPEALSEGIATWEFNDASV